MSKFRLQLQRDAVKRRDTYRNMYESPAVKAYAAQRSVLCSSFENNAMGSGGRMSVDMLSLIRVACRHGYLTALLAVLRGWQDDSVYLCIFVFCALWIVFLATILLLSNSRSIQEAA